MLQKGMRLNETYRIEESIGTGGGGIVYKAYHERLETYVAVKQIRDRVKGILEHRAEVDILKNLKSPYLPQVFDFLEIDGEIYTVMEFIPGNSLDQELKERHFTQKEVLKWTTQLAQALDYLHSQRPPIIHSDIKPGNIMLTPSGDICLIDFNISLSFSKDAKRFAGISRGYSPPEQYRNYESYRARIDRDKTVMDMSGTVMDERTEVSGAAERLPHGTTAASTIQSTISDIAGRGVDERSDIYSLGATVYHLLTGIHPSQDFEDIKPIESMDIDIGEGFAVILAKMMALDPGQRYQNGGELRYALEHIYEMDSEFQSARRGRRVRQALAALAFVAGAALAACGLVQMYGENQAAYNSRIAEAEELIEAGSYDEASEAIAEAVRRDPGQIEAYEKELLRLYTIGSYEEAVSYAQQTVADASYVIEDETDEVLLADFFYLLGNSYMELEDYQNAAYYLSLALAYNSDNAYYYRDLAIAEAKSGDTERSQETLEKAVRLGLAQDSIAMAQGEIAYAQGDYESAAEYFVAVIDATQDDDLLRRAVILCAQAYQNLGDSYLDDAIALLESAQNRFSVSVSMQITQLLGEVYVSKANSDEAYSQYYEKALELFLELYENGYTTRQMMENIAILYEDIDAFEEAAEMFAAMEESYPDDYRTYKRLAFLEADIQQELAADARDYTSFVRYYEKAAELYEQSGSDGDTEMQMLVALAQDLRNAGWI